MAEGGGMGGGGGTEKPEGPSMPLFTKNGARFYVWPPITPRSIATALHAGQRDKAGRPYVEHLERVVARVPREWEAAAWLHDALEDCGDVAAEDLYAWGVEWRTVKAVGVLTRRPSESYAAYIRRVELSRNEGALVVKLADLADHLEVRPEAIGRSMRERYRKADRVLQEALLEYRAWEGGAG